MPSWALRTAWFRPRTCPRSFSEIVRPAASSAARLIRSPLDSFSTLFASDMPVVFRLRCAFTALMFVLIRTSRTSL